MTSLSHSFSQGAYRLAVDGVATAAGPGRAEHATADTPSALADAINLTAALQAPGLHVLALQGYHAATGPAGIHLVLRLWYANGSCVTFASIAPRKSNSNSSVLTNTSNSSGTTNTKNDMSSLSWSAFDATAYVQPSGSTGGAYAQPLENYIAKLSPGNWTLPAYTPSAGWTAAESMPAFQPLPQLKSTPPLEVAAVVPQSVQRVSAGHWFVDFGSEVMAGLRVHVDGVSFCCGIRAQ